MDFQESKLYDLDLGVKVTQNVAKYHPHHVTYAPVNFEVAMSNGSGKDSFTRKYIIWPWGIWPWPQGQGHMKCCLVPSTSCDLCTGKIWSCYLQNIMRRCVFKKIHYLTFDLDLGVKVTQNVAQYHWLHVTYAQAKNEVATSKSLWGDAFTHFLTFDLDLGVKVTRNVTQFPLHHVIYAPIKFEVATSNGLGEDTITRNVTDGRTDARTDGQTDDGPTLVRN